MNDCILFAWLLVIDASVRVMSVVNSRRELYTVGRYDIYISLQSAFPNAIRQLVPLKHLCRNVPLAVDPERDCGPSSVSPNILPSADLEGAM